MQAPMLAARMTVAVRVSAAWRGPGSTIGVFRTGTKGRGPTWVAGGGNTFPEVPSA